MDKALSNNDFSEKSMKYYQKLWKKEIERELFIDSIIQNYFSKISTNDKLLNKIYETINTDCIINMIDSLGDIDYPARVVF